MHFWPKKHFSAERKNGRFNFGPMDQFWPEIGIFGHFGSGLAGSFGALLEGWMVVVAHRLYLARHLFTLVIGRETPLID